jgi:CO/xanthine dehydrogenase Mo-binding subunit
MGAIANAVSRATGVRFESLPMSPPKVRKAIDEARAAGSKDLKM